MLLRITICVLFFYTFISAQNELTGIVTDEHTGEPVPGANVLLEGTTIGTASDINGTFKLENIPNGSQTIVISHIAFETAEFELVFPGNHSPLEVELEEIAEEIEEVFVNATRSSRNIDDEPTRVEVIAGEEIDEKISMDPSNISMVLNESTGILVQQTSALSVNNTFRIQGLDGKYTQLLKDGFPLFSGFSGSLSIMQIPPLDLQQIEVIKGSSSTLYGGGAIAGLINLISRAPSEERNISFLVNGTIAGGLDLSGFYSNRNESTGITALVSRNYQKAYDSNDDKYSDLPLTERYTVNPRFFFYPDSLKTLEAGFSFITEERTGGSIPLIEGGSDSLYTYMEENLSSRFTAHTRYTAITGGGVFDARGSFSYFNRKLIIPSFTFNGVQYSGFAEAVYRTGEESQWLGGINLFYDRFDDKSVSARPLDNEDVTFGVFGQNNHSFSNSLFLETGLRTDYNTRYGAFLLPRVSLLIKLSESVSSRIGGGLGYKLPSTFSEQSEELGFRNIKPLDKENLSAEKSYGINADINYRTILFDKFTLSFNNLFFYTRINRPLLLFPETGNSYEFRNADGHYDTRGIETNIKFTYDHIKLFTGYTYTYAEIHAGANRSSLPLTPKHRLGIVLMYEKHGDFRIGLEGYYTGRQQLSGGAVSDDYWINGIMIEKRFGSISLFLNFENFLDVKQADFGPIFTGSPSNPDFVEYFAPSEGRIINGGVKINI